MASSDSRFFSSLMRNPYLRSVTKSVFVLNTPQQPPHLAVSQIKDFLADVSDVGFRLVVRGAAGNVPVGFRQA